LSNRTLYVSPASFAGETFLFVNVMPARAVNWLMKTFWAAIGIIFFNTLVWANWPAWRGPEGTGVARESNLPLRWSTNENVRWRTPLPERGNSTPIIWKDRIFVTQAVSADNRRTLMCFGRKTGKLLWQKGVTYSEKEPTHDTNPYCSASAVTDGERVVASYGSAGLYCYDFAGKELWHRDLGKQHHIWGNAASPVLHGNLCILNVGPGEQSYLIALDQKTGSTVWQADEPGGHYGQAKPGEDAKAVWVGSWTTPIIIKEGGEQRLIMSFPNRVASLDPKSGKEIWTCSGLNPLVYTSPLYDDGIIVAMGGFSGSAVAVKTGGKGDVTETHRLWQHPRAKQRIGSGVIHDGHIYILNEPPIAECYELKSGKLVSDQRLKGPGPKGETWSSMVLAGDKLYVINQSGDTFVLKATPKLETVAVNSLGEFTNASIAPSDGEIFIRTHKNLWCVAD
jgi:outer membrane protein assembly factor BamB